MMSNEFYIIIDFYFSLDLKDFVNETLCNAEALKFKVCTWREDVLGITFQTRQRYLKKLSSSIFFMDIKGTGGETSTDCQLLEA